MAKMTINITDHFGPGGLKERFIAAADKAAGDIADAVFQKSQEICTEVAYDLGDLLGSGFVTKLAFLKYTVGYNAPYAQAVEFGSKPHWPPPVAIYEWCRRKVAMGGGRMDPTEDNVKRLFDLAFGREKAKNETERAFIGIYRKIGTVGTAPHPFFRPAVELVVEAVPRLVHEAMIEKGVAK